MAKNENIAKIEKRLEELRIEKEELLQKASNIKGAYLSTYEIRPAGRHVLTIGGDLIQDQYAAIVELVKNCYDADSSDANIIFSKNIKENRLEITIKDHGHGMTTEDIITKWLVPSTDYKLDFHTSPKGRIVQGRKGIGRYAASILGDDLKLETVDKLGNETKLYIQWNELSKYKYLDQIKIPIKTKKTNKNSGTILTIRSKLSENQYWSNSSLNKLRFELKKLFPPKIDKTFNDDFKIILSFNKFFPNQEDNRSEIIQPYPILDFYDYRISTDISADGIGILKYENNRIKNNLIEEIPFDYGITGCGALSIDIRVYDRDKEALDQLISRGLKDETGTYLTKLQARQLLNDLNGIGVYRNGFRIRPLGDSEFDWLKLNERRVQNPSMRIGSNQVVGYVHVESEEKSGLEEKSARDGLKVNDAYDSLKEITLAVIQELEQRRFQFRRKMGLSNPSKKVEMQLEGLYDYSTLKTSISRKLKKAKISKPVIDEITEIISKEEKKKNKTIEDIKHAVAIYQGQATIGKIINVVLHEGRRPLNYFKNQIPTLRFYGSNFVQNKDEDSYNEIVRLTDGIASNSEIFAGLFGRLDPLSAKRRETKMDFILRDALLNSIAVFEKEGNLQGITIELDCPPNIRFLGWKQDIYVILVNLIDNSFYWIVEKKCTIKKIGITVRKTEKGFVLDYNDSGPGIDDNLLESGVIFDPEFTTKPDGTGLGLAIAGEAAMRNNLSLTAVQKDNGAHFILSTND